MVVWIETVSSNSCASLASQGDAYRRIAWKVTLNVSFNVLL